MIKVTMEFETVEKAVSFLKKHEIRFGEEQVRLSPEPPLFTKPPILVGGMLKKPRHHLKAKRNFEMLHLVKEYVERNAGPKGLTAKQLKSAFRREIRGKNRWYMSQVLYYLCVVKHSISRKKVEGSRTYAYYPKTAGFLDPKPVPERWSRRHKPGVKFGEGAEAFRRAAKTLMETKGKEGFTVKEFAEYIPSTILSKYSPWYPHTFLSMTARLGKMPLKEVRGEHNGRNKTPNRYFSIQ